MVDSADTARAAFASQAWGDAYRLLAQADPDLMPEDLERLAVAAHLVGRPAESDRAWEQAHQAWLTAGEGERAARCGFWLGLDLLFQGEEARAGGWFARAERVLEGREQSCAARGLLLVPVFFEALGSGDLTRAGELSAEMVEIGKDCGDNDLVAFGVLGGGQTAVSLGQATRGMRLLDEVMVSVTTGEVSAIASGIVYCAVIEACMDAFDVRRAGAWTDAFHGWCASQPDLVAYRGQCLVHRSEILQARGGWDHAADEAERAREALSEPFHPAVGLACYQQGELHRLRGDLAAAERAYHAADEHGRPPAPGLALLRLAEGNVDAAAIAIRRMVDESAGQPVRPLVLAAAAEILIVANDVEGARAALDELAEMATTTGVPLLQAIAAFAAGSLLLAEAQPGAALPELRRACSGWLALDMPYNVARARVQIGRAYQALGDEEAGANELEMARATFDTLGAGPDLERIATLAGGARLGSPALTERERAVLRLVASGGTNREIGAELSISEHTVARHVQNIFTKVGVSSRAAATAFAYEHGLV